MPRHRSRVLAALVGVAAAVLLSTVAPLPASAHSTIVDSTPAEGETLTGLPTTFSVTANEDLLDVTGESAGFALQVIGADGLHYERGCPVVDGATLAMPVSIGAAGEYELRYQVVSADGHPISGAIPFTWAPAGSFEAVEGTAESMACASSDETRQPTATPQPEEAGGANPAVWIAVAAGIGAAFIAIFAGNAARRRRKGSGGDVA